MLAGISAGIHPGANAKIQKLCHRRPLRNSKAGDAAVFIPNEHLGFPLCSEIPEPDRTFGHEQALHTLSGTGN